MKKVPYCLSICQLALTLSLVGTSVAWGHSEKELETRLQGKEVSLHRQGARVESLKSSLGNLRAAYRNLEETLPLIRRDVQQTREACQRAEQWLDEVHSIRESTEVQFARHQVRIQSLGEILQIRNREMDALKTRLESYWSWDGWRPLVRDPLINEKQQEINSVTDALQAEQEAMIAADGQRVQNQEILAEARGLVESLRKELTQKEVQLTDHQWLLRSLTSQDALESLRLEQAALQEGSIHAAYGTLLSKLHGCKQTDPLPLVDWLLIRQMGNTMDPSPLRRNQTANGAPVSQSFLCLSPYGLYSNYSLHGKTFQLRTGGALLDGGVVWEDNWCLGASTGYAVSHLDYYGHYDDTTINSVSVAPFGAYLSDQGFAEVKVLGMYNHYSTHQNSLSGWDLDLHVGGGLNVVAPQFLGQRAFVRPWVSLDYLFAFHDLASVRAVKVTRADFFSSCLAMDVMKEFELKQGFLLIPSVSAGWALMQPVSQKATSYASCKSTIYPTSNQAYVGAKLTGDSKQGFLLALGFEGYLGSPYSVYAGTLDFNWAW